MSANLLASALYHHEAGRPTIAVNKAKKPYLRGWAEYFTRPQSKDEVRKQFSDAELVSLTLAVVAINGWNRFAISFRTVPGTYQPAHR